MYRSPGGPVTSGAPGNPVTLHFRACKNDLTAAQVRVWEDRLNSEFFLPMALVASDATYEWWEATVPASALPTIYWYCFKAMDGPATAYYADDDNRGGWGYALADQNTAFGKSYQLSVYDPSYTTPDWVKNGIIYQIFPDRFRDGNPSNNTPAGSFFYGTTDPTIVRSNTTTWNQTLCDPREATGPCPGKYSNNFYGGDLQGIIDKLDYLQQLGVTVLYLNPIFESPSNHKYDTADYGVIDDNFGDLTAFQTLATQAAARGMRIILDGVFNHTSSDSFYFDRYHRYGATGACESQTAPNRSWYYFWGGSGPCDNQNYDSWAGYDSLPKLNSSNSSVRDLIWQGSTPSPSSAIIRYWLQQGASGWRLDVGGDVDPGLTSDPSNNYWEGFRTAARTQKSDAYITGEEWGYGTPWLLGGEWDAVMNYQFHAAVLSFWRDDTLYDNDHDSSSSAGPLSPLTPTQLDARLRNIEERYPPPAFAAMMNLLDSHDTNRALFLLDENADLYNQSIYAPTNYDWSDAITRLKGAVLLQMTLPGAPTIYYGDEVGLIGPPKYVDYGGGNTKWEDDPYNRVPFSWLDTGLGLPYYTRLQSQANQDDVRNYYIKLTTARNAHPALRTGDFRTLYIHDANKIYEYGRVMSDYSDAAVVLVNRNTVAQTLSADVSGYLPVGAQFHEVLTNSNYTVDATGTLTVPNVAARSGAVLVSTGGLVAPPSAPANVTAAGCVSVNVKLNWDAVSGADKYYIYRSILKGGGYQLIGNTTGTAYTDSTVTSGTTYYYVAVSANDTTLLRSGYSTEVSAKPGRPPVGWCNLQWPPTITHTIGLTPTGNVYGRVWVDGITNYAGQGGGIRGQVGYGTGGDPSTWAWSEAIYNTDSGNNDEYMGQMLPEYTGTFSYRYRFTTSNGCEWTYCDPPGTLTVNPDPADTEAPSVPANLAITAVTAAYIDLSWNASTDNVGVYAYDLFRSTDGSSPGSFVARVLSPTLVYRDSALLSGSTYSYVVQAVDRYFNRSGYSNQVTEQVAEVPSLSWDAAGTGLSWTYAPRATSYTVYRGTLAGLPHLLDATTDSCTRYAGAAQSTTISDVPAESELYWYLVVGGNRAGQGPAGNSRILNSSGNCP